MHEETEIVGLADKIFNRIFKDSKEGRNTIRIEMEDTKSQIKFLEINNKIPEKKIYWKRLVAH